MMRRQFWAVVCVAGLLAAAARADDVASQVGRSVFIANEVDGRAGDAPVKRIAINDDIVFQEDITTGGDAKAITEFRDGSTFEIGPNAAIRIDSFVFNPEESASHKALQVTRGVFRYVSAYVASDQDTKIAIPSGTMGIRGSLAAGIVDPAVPDFIYLGEGNATFTNPAGSAALQPGNSIAVPSATTIPMAPDAMPAPVAVQALQAIQTRLPPQAALANRPAADDAWLKRAGTANLVPATEQQRIASAAAGTSRPLPAAAGSGSLAGELGLLVEANRVNLFNGRSAARTAEQTAFLARAARENPGAAASLRRFTAEARAMHSASVTRGTEFVIRGVGHAAPSAEVMRRVTAASTRANPGAAGLINRHATEAYRGADRGELNRPNRPGADRGDLNRSNRPGAERPVAQRPAVHPPNDFERRQPGFERKAPGPNTRPPAQRRPAKGLPAPQQRPAKPAPQKAPAGKKGDEQRR